MAAIPTAQAVIEGFLLRTQRVMAHSLIREQAALMSKLHSPTAPKRSTGTSLTSMR